MKRYFAKGLLPIMLTLAMVLTMLSVTTTPAFAAVDTTRYGWNTLTEENLKDAYRAIVDGVSSKVASIDLSDFSLTPEQFDEVWELYSFDYGEHYWLPKESSCYSSGGKVTTLELTYLTGFDTELFATKTEELLAAAADKSTEYDKALALHDALVTSVSYNTEGTNAYNAYGAIVEKEAVCEGYAEAYQYLLQRVGIQSYIVTGTAGDLHEWNLVRLDGQYYYTDVTWDDPDSQSGDDVSAFYAYFNITTARITENHIITDIYSILPECIAVDARYKGYHDVTGYSVDGLAAGFKNVAGRKIARIYCTGEPSDNFDTWCNENAQSLVLRVSPSGGAFSYSICGREHYLVITPSGKTLSGVVSDDSATNMASATVTLWQNGAEKATATSDANGAYKFWGLSAGSYELSAVSADTTKSGRTNVTMSTEDMTQNLAVHARLKGDVNGDGGVDYGDLQRLYQHLSTDNKLTGEALVVADTNESGSVDYGDLQRLYQHLSTSNKFE